MRNINKQSLWDTLARTGARTGKGVAIGAAMVAGLGVLAPGVQAAAPVFPAVFKISAAHVPGEVLVKFRSLPGQASDQAMNVAAVHAQLARR